MARPRFVAGIITTMVVKPPPKTLRPLAAFFVTLPLALLPLAAYARAVPDSPLTERAPSRAKPWVPGWGFYPRAPETWLRYHRHLAAGRGHGSVVFFGDSLTLEWPEKGRGRADWRRRCRPLGVRNYGVGGDTTRQALWRISQGELDGLRPRLVVLMIGTDNLGDALGDGTDAEVAQGVLSVVRALRRHFPQARVLLLGLLPRQDVSFCRRVAAVNRVLVAHFQALGGVRYLDMGGRFLAGPGRINRALYTQDQLHLTAQGYHVWAEAMGPLLAAMSRRVGYTP